MGTHYIYRGLWVGDGFIWILDFWWILGWILWDEGEQKVGFAEKKLRLSGGVGGCVDVGIEGRAQNIAPLQVEKWL